MKISYRREMKHNYLILDPEDLEWDGYECRMLAANAIEGVLRFQIRQVDESIYFYYEITSRQPLSRMLDGRPLRAEELRSLVVGIARVVDRMEQYLLRESSVMLTPEYLYVDPENFRVWLCLVPGIQSNFPEDYAKLLEYLLGKVDHQDRDSVVLAYALYQETRKPDYGMNEILRLLQNSGYKKQTGKNIFSPARERNGWENDAEIFYEDENGQSDMVESDGPDSGNLEEAEAFGGMWKKNENEGGDRKEIKKETTRETKREKKKREKEERRRQKKEEREKKEQKKQGLWARIREWWRKLWGRKTEFSDREKSENIYVEDLSRGENGEEDNSWERMFASEEDNRIGQMENSSISFPKESRSQDIHGENQDEIDWSKCSFSSAAEQDTLILGALNSEQSKENHRLIALDPGLQDIELRYYPFIIGKQENLVDFVLERDVVSRLHMRVDYVDSEYTIEDLNSTNGTVVAGKMLEANETVVVREGDEVKIADCRYRFVL